MFDESPEKMRAARAFLIFGLLFFSFAIGLGVFIGIQRGHGTGPWDSHITWSCYTPGGPYYLKDKPVSEQPCPSPTSMNLKSRLPLQPRADSANVK